MLKVTMAVYSDSLLFTVKSRALPTNYSNKQKAWYNSVMSIIMMQYLFFFF